MTEYIHWQLYKDTNFILWLSLDKKGSSVNTLDQEVMTELNQILDHIKQDERYKGLVIRSEKKNSFIVGADIKLFSQVEDVNNALYFVRMGQQIFSKLENLTIPTIALIEGTCLGGGLELALACQYRIVLEDSNIRLGLPEIQLGIHPGWGGTVRLLQLIGVLSALDLILTGRTISPKKALQLGLIEEIVPKRHIIQAVESYLVEKPRAHFPAFYNKLFNLAFIRKIIALFLRKKIAIKANIKHYPAPFAVIDNWERAAKGEAAYLAEAQSVAQLLMTSTSKNLVRVFFLQERLKNAAKDSEMKIEHVHVLGAGIMGGDIAAWCALKGRKVTLQDTNMESCAAALKRAKQLFKDRLKDSRMVQAALDRITIDRAGMGIVNADLIIEAISESLELKQSVFKTVEANAKPSAIFATNTSSIPLDQINQVLSQPERLVGIHFFNPVAKMPLVEIVIGDKTSPVIAQAAAKFISSLGKLPLSVKSAPGFLVNRVLMPYLMECMELVQEGLKYETIDQAAVELGMPMGPVELADKVGLDICLSVAKNLIPVDQYPQIFAKLTEMVTAGNLGKKTGEGFYKYKNNQPQKTKMQETADQLQIISKRLLFRLLNESVAALGDHIVADSDLLDAGMIFGAGFPPFLGGPIHYAKTLGIENCLKTLQQLQQQYGERFNPDAAWHNMDL